MIPFLLDGIKLLLKPVQWFGLIPRRLIVNMVSFTVPVDRRYFEDYVAGSVYIFGSIKVENDEMIEFARKFDPQPFHLDPETARRSSFGGLIASGWHTACLMMRLFVEHYLSKVASLARVSELFSS